MEAISFKDIAQLLNNHSRTQVDPEPIVEGEGWDLHQGYDMVRGTKYRFDLLYLKSSATVAQLREAAGEVADLTETEVVYPPSLTLEAKRDIFSDAKRLCTTKEYLKSFISHELEEYTKKVCERKPKDYIEPRFMDRALRRSKPVRTFLKKGSAVNENGSGKLGVVLAEPGQGKTYMSRHLVAEISEGRRDLVPVLVTSNQWDSLYAEDQRSLWKTIFHSFRHFGASIGWMEGHEDEFIRTALRLDLLRIVFDGFDEYVLRNREHVQPADVLKSLATLAEDTGARIVVTSRTSFWDANLEGEDVDETIDIGKIDRFVIEPFNLQLARRYFEKRLQEENELKLAENLYQTLEDRNRQLVGKGFVLNLIADAVKAHGDVEMKITPYSKKSGALVWLIEELCRREELRQELPFNAEEQTHILRSFAQELAKHSQKDRTFADDSVLGVLMGDVKPSLDSATIRSAIDKFGSHPIITKTGGRNNHWYFRQEQIEAVLLADLIVNHLSNKDIRRFVIELGISAEAMRDLASLIIELIKEAKKNERDQLSQLRNLVQLGRTAERGNPVGVSSFASVLARRAVQKYKPEGHSHEERASLLVDLCGGEEIKGLTFVGTLSRFDFRGVRFFDCYFKGLAIANCKFDENTEFIECHFSGGIPPEYSKGFGKSLIDHKTTYDQAAETWINNERIQEGKKSYTESDLRNSVQCVIDKFVTDSGALRRVRKEDLHKGPISSSPMKSEIVSALKKHVIEEATSGYEVRSSASREVMFYADNNSFTGNLNKVFSSLKGELPESKV